MNVALPVNVRSCPRTVLIIMWRIAKPIEEWAGSSSQVAAREGAGASSATASAGTSKRMDRRMGSLLVGWIRGSAVRRIAGRVERFPAVYRTDTRQ